MVDLDTDLDENRGVFQTLQTTDRYPQFGGSSAEIARTVNLILCTHTLQALK
jgi:hypothetical protein